MSTVDQVANAVLYEGYILYPYRPSAVKNRQRWNFGVVYPRRLRGRFARMGRLHDTDRMSGAGDASHSSSGAG